MRSLFVVCGLSVCTLSMEAQQVADSVVMSPIVVTATRTPVSLDRVGARVTVIDGETLRREGVTYLSDALRSVTGVTVVGNGSYGSVASTFVRGGQSDYLLVLIDGVPANEPGGAFNWADLTVTNIERVEIAVGPTSVLYGSHAVTGVVQIFTREGLGPVGADAAARAGGYGIVDVVASARGGGESARFSAEVRRVGSDGIHAFNNQYDNTSMSSRVSVRPDERTRLSASLRVVSGEFHFPTDGTGALSDSNQFQLQETTMLGVDAVRSVTGTVDAALAFGFSTASGGVVDRPDAPGDTIGFFASRSQRTVDRRSIDARVDVRLRHATVVTVGTSYEEARERSVADFQSSFGQFTNTVDERRRNAAIYSQAITTVGKLSLTVGGRLDRHEAFGTFVTGRAAAALQVTPSTRIRSSLGNAFKEPTFIENYGGGFAVGNAALDPERTVSWEVGAEQRALDGRMQLSASYFDQRFRDIIQYTAVPTTPGGSNFQNVAAATARGVELEARVTPVTRFEAWVGYAYLSTRVSDPGFGVGPGDEFGPDQRLLRRPSYSIHAGASVSPVARSTIGVRYRYVGSRDDLDFSAFPAARTVLPSYHLVDVSGRVRLLSWGSAGGIDGTLRVENLFDAKYQEVLGFSAPGRVLLVGVGVGG